MPEANYVLAIVPPFFACTWTNHGPQESAEDWGVQAYFPYYTVNVANTAISPIAFLLTRSTATQIHPPEWLNQNRETWK